MKILKTLFALIAMLLCCTSIFAEDFEVDGIYYNITSEAESTVEVTYKGNSFSSFEEYTGSIIIPSFVKHYGITYKVTRIGEDAFLACRNLTSISIPNSVISIGNGAFDSTPWYDNQPLGLVYAGKVLYKYKGYISTDTNIVIKEGTLGIADHAFYDCKELTAIALPSTLRNIGESAFMDCKGLKSIVVPEYVTSIGDFAFAGCSVLEDCLINSESITKIGMSVFSFCTSLKSMSIPNSVTSIGMEAFSGCSELSNITIGDNVNYIYNNAFRNCRSLISVTIPKRVSTISHETFNGCI